MDTALSSGRDRRRGTSNSRDRRSNRERDHSRRDDHSQNNRDNNERFRSRSRDRPRRQDSRDRRERDRDYNRNRDRLHDNNEPRRDQQQYPQQQPSHTSPATIVVPKDTNLRDIHDDPRIDERNHHKIAKKSGGGRNTESFDPESTLVRPALRVLVGPNQEEYNKVLSHDDVLLVPNFFCQEDDWSLYYKLIEEMREIQQMGEKGSEWISWHEGAHLISKNPTNSPTFKMIIEKISKYYNIELKSVGTRFNWYRDSTDWKPFHHDSAAFNPERARNQNITVGVSFGATRELAFIQAGQQSVIPTNKIENMLSFPQTNGMLFSFGRDVNLRFKHGVRAIDPTSSLNDGKGRISIILWGQCNNVIEEKDSPPMLPYQGNHGDPHRRNNNNNRNQVCREFTRGNCKYGDSCKFQHK